MKFIHLSDLHLGKRIYETSLIEDQQHILAQILEIVDGENPDGVLIAGDVYDKAIQSVEAINLFDDFLNRLYERSLPVFIISGNHDSAERMAFGAKIMSPGGIYIAPPYQGEVYKVDLEDGFGPLHIFMLPFVKKSLVKSLFPEEEIETTTDALRCVLSHTQLNGDDRNILIAHQFITGSQTSDSEEYAVGGADNVDAFVFDAFDYVALGHIHGPQPAGRETIRYCGTPLKYSFSEVDHEKSVTVVEMKEKGSVLIRTIPLKPLRDMKQLKGSYQELMNAGFTAETNRADFYRIILTDENDVTDAIARLRTVYPNILTLEYDNKRTQASAELTEAADTERKTPYDLFAEFFEWRNNAPMEGRQQKIISDLIQKIWEEEA